MHHSWSGASIQKSAMKRAFLLLLLLFFIIFLITPCEDQIVSITIIIPQKFVPYYDWLIDFPGWQPVPEEPIPTEIRVEYGENPSLSTS